MRSSILSHWISLQTVLAQRGKLDPFCSFSQSNLRLGTRNKKIQFVQFSCGWFHGGLDAVWDVGFYDAFMCHFGIFIFPNREISVTGIIFTVCPVTFRDTLQMDSRRHHVLLLWNSRPRSRGESKHSVRSKSCRKFRVFVLSVILWISLSPCNHTKTL